MCACACVCVRALRRANKMQSEKTFELDTSVKGSTIQENGNDLFVR